MQFWSEIILVISNQTRATRSFDFEITCMISDQIALHLVQLPLLIILIQILTMSVCSKIFPNHRDTGGFTSKPEVPQQEQGAWYVWSLKIFVCLTGGLLGHYWQPQLLDGAVYQLQSSLWQCWPWMPNNFLLLIPVLSYMACLPFSLFSSSSHPSSDSKICFIN